MYYIDAPLVRFYDDNTDGAGIVEHDYGHDAQFNVTVVHDVSANVVERYTYTPYGELVIMNASWSTLNSSAIANAYTYTGREYDAETGLFNFRNRYYHAQLGRFVNRNPIGYWDGFNFYQAYFVPNGSDPFGLGFWDLIFGTAYYDSEVEAELERHRQKQFHMGVLVGKDEDPIQGLRAGENQAIEDATNLAAFGVGWTAVVLGGAFITGSGASFAVDDLASFCCGRDFLTFERKPA